MYTHTYHGAVMRVKEECIHELTFCGALHIVDPELMLKKK